MQVAPRHDFAGLKLLVVEDHEDSRELFVAIFEDLGATVLAAGTAEQALQLLKEHRPDLVISDIGLPQDDGHTLLRNIRRLPATEGGRTPAIAVTAYATFRDRRDALEAGFDAYLSKPVDIKRLCDTVEQFVSGPSSVVRPNQ
jgi:CheY-like chemotaxis protein